MRSFEYLKNVTTLSLDASLCTACRMCEAVCPHAVFRVADKKCSIEDKDACMECGACAKNCRAGALTVKAGVGCAAAVINSMIGKSGACECDCSC